MRFEFPSEAMDDLWLTDILRRNLDRARESTDAIKADLDRAEHFKELAIKECRLRQDFMSDLKQQLKHTSSFSWRYSRLQEDYERSIDPFINARQAESDAQREVQGLLRDLGDVSRTEREAEDEYLNHLDQIQRRREAGARRLAEEAEQMEADELWRQEREFHFRRQAGWRRRERSREVEREHITSQRRAEDEEDYWREEERAKQREEGARRLAEDAQRLRE